ALPPAPMPMDGPLPAPAAPIADPALLIPVDAPLPAPVDAPPVDEVVTAASWHADVPLQPMPGDPARPVLASDSAAAPASDVAAAPASDVAAAPASDVLAASAPVEPLAPLAGVNLPGPAADVANQALAEEAGTPHLASPENLPPGTTVDPNVAGNSTPNRTYLKEIWHAIQTQDVSGRDALLALSQRPLSTPDTRGGPSPSLPVPVETDPAAPLFPAPAPAPVLPPS
ncbi:MAG: transglycosylase, partial [Mycobacterium sp.]